MTFHQAKADATKQDWEGGDFPILCETCLGDNPYVRMTREAHGGACKICERPFVVFRWKPGPQARFKKTEVCQMCAKVKNVCQTCVLDLQYGLPVEVRDNYLQQAAAKAGIAGGSSALALASRPMPTSDVNRNYALQQAERAYESGEVTAFGGGASGVAAALPQAHEALMRLSRTQPYYQRNAARLCSFFAKGECNRGGECPYRHEMPRDKADPLAKQNIQDRYHGADDPVAAKILGKLGIGPQPGQGGSSGGEGGSGTSSFSRPPLPPADPAACTLWIAGVTESISEDELRTSFTPHGDVMTVRCVPAKQCAFVEMGSRASAEAAVGALWNSLTIGGVFLRVAWARPKVEKEGTGSAGGQEGGESQGRTYEYSGQQQAQGSYPGYQAGYPGYPAYPGYAPFPGYPPYPYPFPYPYPYPGPEGEGTPAPTAVSGPTAQAEGGEDASSVDPNLAPVPPVPQNGGSGDAPSHSSSAVVEGLGSSSQPALQKAAPPAGYPNPPPHYPTYPYPYPYPPYGSAGGVGPQGYGYPQPMAFVMPPIVGQAGSGSGAGHGSSHAHVAQSGRGGRDKERASGPARREGGAAARKSAAAPYPSMDSQARGARS